MKYNQLANKRYYDKKRKSANVYNVGDYVMIFNNDTTPGVNKKLLPMFKGPYVIVIVKKMLDHDRYIVEDIDGFQVTQKPYSGTCAASQMKPYINEAN